MLRACMSEMSKMSEITRYSIPLPRIFLPFYYLVHSSRAQLGKQLQNTENAIRHDFQIMGVIILIKKYFIEPFHQALYRHLSITVNICQKFMPIYIDNYYYYRSLSGVNAGYCRVMLKTVKDSQLKYFIEHIIAQ